MSSPSVSTRVFAACGIAGVVCFIGAWTIGGLGRAGYSAISDPISELARVGTSSAPVMNVGFLGYALGAALFSIALRRTVGGGAWIAALATGVGVFCVFLTPLGGADALHGVAALATYIALIAMPALAVRPLFRAGYPIAGGLSIANAVITLLGFVLSTSAWSTGYWQRFGITSGDVWIVVVAIAILRGWSLDRRSAPVGGPAVITP